MYIFILRSCECALALAHLLVVVFSVLVVSSVSISFFFDVVWCAVVLGANAPVRRLLLLNNVLIRITFFLFLLLLCLFSTVFSFVCVFFFVCARAFSTKNMRSMRCWLIVRLNAEHWIQNWCAAVTTTYRPYKWNKSRMISSFNVRIDSIICIHFVFTFAILCVPSNHFCVPNIIR